jgi:hypothetical protein
MDELQQRIIKDHEAAEILRLRAGFDSCGCQDCQTFYKTLDLSIYGDRVLTMGGVTCIVAGRAGADKWVEYHQDDTGSPTSKATSKRSTADRVVLSQPDSQIIPTASDKTPNNEVKHGGGRPRLDAGYSKRTEYRRQKEQQAIMTLAE